MDRIERIKICETCKNRKLNLKTGLVCKLTNEDPDFEGSCPSYVEDNKASDEKFERELKAVGHKESGSDIDPKSNDIFGTISIVGGALLAIVGLYMGKVSTTCSGIGLIIYGYFLYQKGLSQKKMIEERNRNKETNE